MNEFEKNTPSNSTNTSYNDNASNINNNNINSSIPLGEKTSPQKKEKKGNNKLIIIAIILLLLLAATGVLVYCKLVNSKNIFKTLINDTFTYLEENINYSDTASGTFSLKVGGTSSDSPANNMLDIMSKLELSGNYGIDYKNKLMNIDIATKYENEKLVNASIYTENGNGYVGLEEIYDKYIKIPIENYDSIFNNIDKNDDYKVVFKSINKALTNSLKDEYFTKEKATVDSVKTTKTTLKLSEENYNSIKKEFINKLLNDNEFLKSFSSISEKSVDDIKTELNKSLEEDDFEGVNISIYTKGLKNEFVKFEIADSTDSIVITKDNDTYNYELTEDKKVTYDGSLKITGDKNNATCTFTINDKKENNTITLNFKSTTKYNTAISKVDVSNSIAYENITQEDTNNITTKILENKTIMKLIEDISKLSTNYNSATNTSLDNIYNY